MGYTIQFTFIWDLSGWTALYCTLALSECPDQSQGISTGSGQPLPHLHNTSGSGTGLPVLRIALSMARIDHHIPDHHRIARTLISRMA